MASNGKWVNPTRQERAGDDPTFQSLSAYLGGWQTDTGRVAWVNFAGTGFALGNGVYVGEYKIQGDECVFRGSLVFGTTTNVGIGGFTTITLPIAVHAGTSAARTLANCIEGTAWFVDASTGNTYTLVPRMFSTVAVAWQQTNLIQTFLSPTVPVVPANGDSLDFQIRYRSQT